MKRAVPQHRRGTSIKPREEEDFTVWTANDAPEDTIVVSSPKKDELSSERRTEDGIVLNITSNSAPKKKRKKEKPAMTPTDVSEVALPNINVEPPSRLLDADDVAEESQAMAGAESVWMKEGIVIASAGQSRPRRKDKNKKKDKKREPAATDSEIPEETTAKEVQATPVHSDGLPGGAVGKPGPKRKKKKIVEPTEEMQEWLDIQLDVEADANETKSKKRRKKQKKETGEIDSAQAIPNSAEETRKLQPSNPRGSVKTSTMAEEADTRPSAMKQFQTAERGTVLGKWSQEELDLADETFHDFCKHNNISEPELRLKTTEWATLGPFKVELYNAFPGRRLDVIRKHMQRRFSPYEKGAWSEEETQRLKDAYAKQPDQWAQIAKEVERDMQSCRDHWRHQVMYADSMDRGAWSIAEEVKLIEVVDEAVALIMKTTDDPKIRKDRLKAESTINWSEVAKKMDGKRNRKRCFEKWKLLKRRGDKPREEPSTAPTIEDDPNRKETKLSRKRQIIERQYATMRPGDVQDAISELMLTLNLIPDTDFHDDSTFWSVVAQRRNDTSVFKTTALLRRAYLGAIQSYSSRRLRKATGYREKAQAVYRKMQKLGKKGKLDLESKAFGPETSEPKPEKRAKKLEARSKKQTKEQGLSEDVVRSSDDEEETTVRAKSVASVHGRDVGDEIVIPETQTEQVAGAEEDSASEEITVGRGSADDEDAESTRSATPHLSPEAFVDKCKKAGRKQHHAYLKGYGR